MNRPPGRPAPPPVDVHSLEFEFPRPMDWTLAQAEEFERKGGVKFTAAMADGLGLAAMRAAIWVENKDDLRARGVTYDHLGDLRIDRMMELFSSMDEEEEEPEEDAVPLSGTTSETPST